MSTAPLISVVVAVYNDRDRLPRALRSALVPGVMEVVVVDDGSPDGSADVAEAMAVADPRVRVLRRGARSGFPGVPRNLGLEAARGTYVLFLDSDDELESSGVASALAAAEASGADAVFGRVLRINPSRGTTTEWMPWLYEQLGETTLAERPELVGETTIGGKLLRRSVVGELRYPEDILYEDLTFAAGVATRLRRVVVLGAPLYRWYVRAQEDDRSITNSRREAGNLEYRLEAHRRARECLSDVGREDLLVAHDRKVRDHDLPLLLRDLVERNPEIRSEVLGRLMPYVATLHADVLSSAEQPGALVLAALATGDHDEVLAAAALAYRRQLTRAVVDQQGRFTWPGLHGPAGDVTSVVAPLLKGGGLLTHTVRSAEVDGRRLRLEVTSWQRVGAPHEVEGLIVVDRRRKRRVARARARVRDGNLVQGLTWEADVALGRGLWQVELLGELDVRVVTTHHGERLRWVLGVPEARAAAISVEVHLPGLRRRAAAYQTELGNLSLRRVR